MLGVERAYPQLLRTGLPRTPDPQPAQPHLGTRPAQRGRSVPSSSPARDPLEPVDGRIARRRVERRAKQPVAEDERLRRPIKARLPLLVEHIGGSRLRKPIPRGSAGGASV